VPFQYLGPPTDGRLVQGEILGAVWEFVPVQAPVAVPEETDIRVRSVYHERMIVLTQDCDLINDFKLRSPDEESLEDLNEVEGNIRSVPSVLLCDLTEDLGERLKGSGTSWKRVEGNQDERYHKLPEAQIGADWAGGYLPALYLDFRKTVSLPTPFLYEALRVAGIARVAITPPIYLHDLIHRFHGYHSRVAVED
jgi:hypothetical protein